MAMQKEWKTTVAATVAGEDLARGDFIAALNEIVETPPFWWDCSDGSVSPEEPVRTRYTAGNAGEPCKVIGVCLPFVYALTHRKQVVVIDTRRQQIVRLDRDCARAIWKKMKRHSKKSRR